MFVEGGMYTLPGVAVATGVGVGAGVDVADGVLVDVGPSMVALPSPQAPAIRANAANPSAALNGKLLGPDEPLTINLPVGWSMPAKITGARYWRKCTTIVKADSRLCWTLWAGKPRVGAHSRPIERV